MSTDYIPGFPGTGIFIRLGNRIALDKRGVVWAERNGDWRPLYYSQFYHRITNEYPGGAK